MPVICTKEKCKYEIITGRVLEKRKADSKSIDQTLRTFSVKNTDSPRNSRFFIGTSIPNSTAKGIINWKEAADSTVSEDQHISGSVDYKLELQKKAIGHDENRNRDDGRYSPPQNPFPIVPKHDKFKELQELHKQLQKSYAPKPLFAPRRPTLESIKSAIEKAKQENERNKSVGTEDIDYKCSVVMTDASTSTEKIVKKKLKKRISKEASMSNSSPGSDVKARNTKKSANKKED